jgi:hypothetical protein
MKRIELSGIETKSVHGEWGSKNRGEIVLAEGKK